MTDWEANYKSLVGELARQADWWQERATLATTPEARAMLDGCGRKLAYILKRRDEFGNVEPGPRARIAEQPADCGNATNCETP